MNSTFNSITNNREIPYIHLVRVVACIMVVMLHSIHQPAFYAPNTLLDKLYTIFVGDVTMSCVPLFFMITGVLILPIKQPEYLSFYHKRIPRVLYPLLVWGVIYAILPYLLGIQDLNTTWKELILSPIKAPREIGGILWYLFVLIGLYLFLPFLNPDIFTNQKKMRFYLLLWLVATVIFDLRRWNDELLGATFKTKVDLMYYFGGFIGYLILGKYLYNNRLQYRGGGGKKQEYTIIIILFIGSFLFRRIFSTNNFLSFTSVMITVSIFLFLQRVKINVQSKFYTLIKNISTLSFGIYLCHMVIFKCITERIYYTIEANWYIQTAVMILTFLGAYLLTLILDKLPFKKYIIG